MSDENHSNPNKMPKKFSPCSISQAKHKHTLTLSLSLSLSLSLLLGKSQSLVDSSLTHLSLDSFHLCSFYDMSLAFISSSLCVDVSTWVWLSILSSGSRTKSIQSIDACHEAMKLTHYNQFYQYQNLRIAINIFIRGRMGTCPLLSLFFLRRMSGLIGGFMHIPW